MDDQNGGVVVEYADVDGTAQEEVSDGETAAATTMDHQYSMCPEQQPVNEEEAAVSQMEFQMSKFNRGERLPLKTLYGKILRG